MRVHRYLEDVLGSKVKIMVMRELFKYPSKASTIRELAESIKEVTHTGIRKALGDLQGANIIRVEHHGQSNLVTLNGKSSIYNTLKTLFEEEQEKYYRLTQDLMVEIPNKIHSCAIFGSLARKSENANSDIDMLFITDNQELVMDYVEKTSKKISNKYGNVIVPYIMSKDEFIKKKNTAFVKSVLDNYKMLSGEDLLKLKQ